MSTTNHRKDAWKITPYLRQEGIFEGTVVRIRRMVSAEGCMILVRMDDALTATMTEELKRAEENYLKSQLPENLRNYIYREVIAAKGSVKIGVFFYGWPESDSDDETEIESLLLHTRPGHRIRFRMSKNWRRDRFYCRYINNLDNDEWSGYEDEADWRQAYHPYPSFPKSGTFDLQICHAEHIMEEFDFAYSLEVKPYGKYSLYRLTALKGSQAYKILHNVAKSASRISNSNIHRCVVKIDEETGKSFVTEIEVQESPTMKNDYARLKKISDQSYERITNDEFVITNGIYHAVVVNDNGINFERSSSFIPFRLDDGRLIMPEIRSRAVHGSYASVAALEQSQSEKTDLMKNRKYLFPDVEVTLYFSPGRKGNFMILRAITSNSDEISLERQRENWLSENSADIF